MLSSILYQLRARIVKDATHMIDSNSVHFPLYPLSRNLQRMLRFSGTLDSDAITPLEVSDFLYQISNENTEEFVKKAKDRDWLIIRAVRIFIFNSERMRDYQHYSRKVIGERESFIKHSHDYLKRTVKICSLDDLPVALASNSIYAASKMNLDFNNEINNVFVPLVAKKMKYMHAQGIVETIWGLANLKHQDKSLVEKLVSELKSRPRIKHVPVVTSPFNHLEYIHDPSPPADNSADLLAKASELTADQELKNALIKLSEEFK